MAGWGGTHACRHALPLRRSGAGDGAREPERGGARRGGGPPQKRHILGQRADPACGCRVVERVSAARHAHRGAAPTDPSHVRPCWVAGGGDQARAHRQSATRRAVNRQLGHAPRGKCEGDLPAAKAGRTSFALNHPPAAWLARLVWLVAFLERSGMFTFYYWASP